MPSRSSCSPTALWPAQDFYSLFNLLQTPTVKVVGAADPAPTAADKDLGLVLGLPRRLRMKVSGDPERFVKKLSADAAIVCTPHRQVKYRELADCVPLIIDTCHVVPRDNHAKVVAA